ncbi:MAG TPA: hypothetical protein DCP28_35110 [Cytophagales bacterium]|nr:hypothetical protein [Cytophagales bacterium]
MVDQSIEVDLHGVMVRLKEFIDYKRLSISKFSKAMGTNPSTISNALKAEGTYSISLSKLLSIFQGFPDLNPMWLLFNNGEMLGPVTDFNEVTDLKHRVRDLQRGHLILEAKLEAYQDFFQLAAGGATPSIGDFNPS